MGRNIRRWFSPEELTEEQQLEIERAQRAERLAIKKQLDTKRPSNPKEEKRARWYRRLFGGQS